MVKQSAGYKVFTGFNYLLFVILGIVFLYPFWDTLVLSFMGPAEATEFGVRLFPNPIDLEGYRQVFSSNRIYLGYANTIFRTAFGTLISVFVTYCGGYALSKKQLPFRNALMMFVLFTMFFNGGLIAIYLNVNSLGLMGSRWALILPLTTSAWFLIIARNFIAALPQELEDAALVDGAHPLKMIFFIMLPLSAPIIAVLTLWTAVLHWNSWFDALLYIRDERKIVLQMVLRAILIEEDASALQDLSVLTQTATRATVKAATIVVSVGPIILMYPFLQKHFIKGILVGSLKG